MAPETVRAGPTRLRWAFGPVAAPRSRRDSTGPESCTIEPGQVVRRDAKQGRRWMRRKVGIAIPVGALDVRGGGRWAAPAGYRTASNWAAGVPSTLCGQTSALGAPGAPEGVPHHPLQGVSCGLELLEAPHIVSASISYS